MSRRARGLMAASVLVVAILAAVVLMLPIAWTVAFFASTTVLTLIALGVEVWCAPRAVPITQSKTRR